MKIWIIVLDHDAKPMLLSEGFGIDVKASGNVQSIFPSIQQVRKGSIHVNLVQVFRTTGNPTLTADKDLKEALREIKFNTNSNTAQRLLLNQKLKDLNFLHEEVLFIRIYGMSRISTSLETFSIKTVDSEPAVEDEADEVLSFEEYARMFSPLYSIEWS
jgi:hypothetical protein